MPLNLQAQAAAIPINTMITAQIAELRGLQRGYQSYLILHGWYITGQL